MIINFINISDRIQYIIDNQHNGVRKRFAERIGFSPQVIANIVSGRKSKPSFDVLNSIISTNDDISAYWLLTGKGEMLKNTVTAKDSNAKDVLNYKEKYIELLEENRNLSINNIKLHKKVYSLQEGKIDSSYRIASEPEELKEYSKKKTAK